MRPNTKNSRNRLHHSVFFDNYVCLYKDNEIPSDRNKFCNDFTQKSFKGGYYTAVMLSMCLLRDEN